MTPPKPLLTEEEVKEMIAARCHLMYRDKLESCIQSAAALGARKQAMEDAAHLVQVLSDLHNAWEFEVKSEKQFDGLVHAAIKKAVAARDAIEADGEETNARPKDAV